MGVAVGVGAELGVHTVMWASEQNESVYEFLPQTLLAGDTGKDVSRAGPRRRLLCLLPILPPALAVRLRLPILSFLERRKGGVGSKALWWSGCRAGRARARATGRGGALSGGRPAGAPGWTTDMAPQNLGKP